MLARHRPWTVPLMLVALLLLGAVAPALAAQDEPLRVGGEVSRPEKISGEGPQYTEIARKAGLSGVVIVEAIIDEKGHVINARILKGLPLGLDQAALEAVQTWRFKPAKLNRKPVKVYYTLTVNFQVEPGISAGPVFAAFLQKALTFRDQLQRRDYRAASEYLDNWARERPEDTEVRLAWAYLLLHQGRLSDSFREALAYKGPGPYEIFYRIAGTALRHATQNSRSLTPAERVQVIELGLRATDKALEDNPDGYEALAYKSLLLKEMAGLAQDPAEREALMREARQLQEKADSLAGEG